MRDASGLQRLSSPQREKSTWDQNLEVARTRHGCMGRSFNAPANVQLVVALHSVKQ